MQILTRMWMKCIMKKMHCKYRLTNQFGWHIQRVRRGQFQSLEKLIGWSDWLTILSEYNIKERHGVQICHNLLLTTRHCWCNNFLQGCISWWPNCLFFGKTTTVYTSFDINLLSSSSLSHSPWTSVAKLVNNKLKTLRRSARASSIKVRNELSLFKTHITTIDSPMKVVIWYQLWYSNLKFF